MASDKPRNNLREFLDSMGQAMADLPAALGGYRLDEIELSLEVGAEGEIGLLGTSGKLSSKGSITLKLTRRDGPGRGAVPTAEGEGR